MLDELYNVMLLYKEGGSVYLIEIPSGVSELSGEVGSVKVWSGQCLRTSIPQVVLLDPRKRVGEVMHLWCNAEDEISIRYSIFGITAIGRYRKIVEWFRPELEGIIKISRGVVTVHGVGKSWV